MEVLLVGCGNMGHAMLTGWIQSGKARPDSIAVIEPVAELRQRAEALGVKAYERMDDLPPSVRPRLVVIAVKPQLVHDILPSYRRFAQEGAGFLSVAAGVHIALFEELLGEGTPVMRCMPNTPAAIGEGVFVTIANRMAAGELGEFAEQLLSASGTVVRIDDENLMDAVTAVSGSGPAYLFHFIECLADAGKAAGLPDEIAELLARKTVLGAALLADKSGESPAELRRKVTSPNGTTAAALEVLMGEDRLKKLLAKAVEAARRRSNELG